MFDWLKTKFHQKQLADRMRKHLATASGPPLHTGAIAVAMAALEDDLVQAQFQKLPVEQSKTFMMTCECIVMWAILRGIASAEVPKPRQLGVALALRDHFSRHAVYVPDQFGRLWEETRRWMPELVKPSKDGNYYPAAALVQVPEAAGCRLGFVPDLIFGIHINETIASLTDIGRFAAQQET